MVHRANGGVEVNPGLDLRDCAGALFLMWAPYNQSRNVRFHAFQSIFLTAAWLVFVFRKV